MNGRRVFISRQNWHFVESYRKPFLTPPRFGTLRGMPLETYILDDKGEPIREPDFDRWCIWYGTTESRIVRQEDLPNGVSVSTVFLGINHKFIGRGPPVLWETMIFGGPHNKYRQRYSSRAEALKGHAAVMALAKGRPS